MASAESGPLLLDQLPNAKFDRNNTIHQFDDRFCSSCLHVFVDQGVRAANISHASCIEAAICLYAEAQSMTEESPSSPLPGETGFTQNDLTFLNLHFTAVGLTLQALVFLLYQIHRIKSSMHYDKMSQTGSFLVNL